MEADPVEIDRARLAALIERERIEFASRNPASAAASEWAAVDAFA